jgi:hypothetical protein
MSKTRFYSHARRAGLVLVLSALAFSPADTAAQYVQSERGSVSQTMEGTTISIDYGRPRIKGRGEPYGDIAWIGDHRWTPGADNAATLSANKPFRLNGHEVPAGGWSMWIDLEPEGFTLVLDPDSVGYHTAPPEDREGQIHIPLETREGPFVETMMFSVPTTRMSGFELVLSWGTTEIPMTIEVERTFAKPIDEEEARSIAGSYAFRPSEYTGPPMPFVVTWVDGAVRARTVVFGRENQGAFPGPLQYEIDSLELVPRGAGIFWEGYVQDGRVFDLEVDVAYEVIRADDGSVERIEARWADDSLLGTIEPYDWGDAPWDELVASLVDVPESIGRELEGSYGNRPEGLTRFDVRWSEGMVLVDLSWEDGRTRVDRLIPRTTDTFWRWDWTDGDFGRGGWEDFVLQVVRDDAGAVVGLDAGPVGGEPFARLRRPGG